MVLNSNTTRFGFTKFWLNCSNSRDCASDAFEYHNINKFLLKASKVSDTSSYMTYSHFKLIKLDNFNSLRVYYYDSKVYDSFLFRKMNSKKINYLINKSSKRNKTFDPSVYFKRSLYSIFLKNLFNNLKLRKIYYYSYFNRFNLNDKLGLNSILQKLFLNLSSKRKTRKSHLVKSLVRRSVKKFKQSSNSKNNLIVLHSLLNVSSRKLKKVHRLNRLGSYLKSNYKFKLLNNLRNTLFVRSRSNSNFLLNNLNFLLNKKSFSKFSKFHYKNYNKLFLRFFNEIKDFKTRITKVVRKPNVLSSNLKNDFNKKMTRTSYKSSFKSNKRNFSTESFSSKWFPKVKYNQNIYTNNFVKKKFKNEIRKIKTREKQLKVLKKYLVYRVNPRNLKINLAQNNDKFFQIPDNPFPYFNNFNSNNLEANTSPVFVSKLVKNLISLIFKYKKGLNKSSLLRFYLKLIKLILISSRFELNFYFNLVNPYLLNLKDDNRKTLLVRRILKKLLVKFKKLKLRKYSKPKFVLKELNFSKVILRKASLGVSYPKNRYYLLTSLVKNNFLSGLNKTNFFRFNFFVKHSILVNYVKSVIPVTNKIISGNTKYLEESFYNYYKFFDKDMSKDEITLDTKATFLSSFFYSNEIEFRNFMALKLFKSLNKPTITFLKYSLSKEIPLMMHSNINKPVIYTPTLLGYQKLNPILYSRFVARRLKQRFNLFETMKVLKNYLKSDESTGYLFKCSGRFTKKQRASIYKFRNGSVPISTFSVPVHYAYDLVRLRYGTCCIKVWISYKG